MKTNKDTITPIEKEALANLNFPPEEVLTNAESKAIRSAALHKATSLGNLEKHKVRITFADEEETKEVFTTIWAVTSHKVVFKGGVVIPVHRILKVTFT